MERIAQKRVLAWRLQQEMEQQGVSKGEMAPGIGVSGAVAAQVPRRGKGAGEGPET